MICRGNARRMGRRAGFTLLEMVIVMWGLAAAMLIGGALILTTTKANRMGETTWGRLNVRADLAKQFRLDVGRAEAAPDKLDDQTAGPNCLILRMPGGSTVVYRLEPDGLMRVSRAGGRESTRVVQVGAAGAQVAFVRPTSPTGVVTLRITEPRQVGAAAVSEISAALGGALR